LKEKMKKLLLLVGIVLLFSCEKKEVCKVCKTQMFVAGETPVIRIDTICYDIDEGYFYTINSNGNTYLKMVVCEK